MDLLIEASLWQPHWLVALQAWQRQGHDWLLLCRGGADPAQWAGCPPRAILSPAGLLAAWLDGERQQDPSQQILLSASPSLLILAKEAGLLTVGPVGADLVLTAADDLAVVLHRLLSWRLTVPVLAEAHIPLAATMVPASRLVLRPLLAMDEAEVLRYCADQALSRYTLHIPHPYPAEAARDWLVASWRRAALGLGWCWALTLAQAEEAPAPLLGVISLQWHGELAWWVGVPWQNRGLASRAAQLVRAFAFDTLQLPALTARHMPANIASGRVMAKLGMCYRGRRGRTARQPCEVSYWRLDRTIRLPARIRGQLACWLADPQVAVVLLYGPWATGEAGLTCAPQCAIFMADEVLPASAHSSRDLVIRCYPRSRLVQTGGEQLPHQGGLLLKDQDEQGLVYLLQLTRLLRQGADC